MVGRKSYGQHGQCGWLRAWCIGVVTFILTAVNAMAQNNPLDIYDELYHMYEEAYKNRNNYRGDQLAEKMYRRAVELNDNRARCLALTVELTSETYKKFNDAAVERKLQHLQNACAKHGQWDLYYVGVSLKCKYLLRDGRNFEALTYAKKMLEQAQIKHNNEGIYAGYRNLGLVRSKRGETIKSIDAYRQALQYGKSKLDDDGLGINYLNLSSAYDNLGDWDSEINYAQEGLKNTIYPDLKAKLLRNICRAYFKLDKKDEFMKAYDELQALDMKNQDVEKPYLDDVLDGYRNLFNGKLKQAKACFDSLMQKPSLWYKDLLLDYYIKRKDYKNATIELEKHYRNHLLRHDRMVDADLRMFDSVYNNQKARSEQLRQEHRNTQMAIKNTQLELNNANMELDRSKAKRQLALLNAENFNLIYTGKQLQAHLLSDSLKYERMQRQNHEKKMQLYSNALIFGIFIIVVIILVISVAAYRTLQIAKKIKAANQDLHQNNSILQKARDEANEADRMKTVFIQNMTHEIRTPLNAIVGFSTILSNGLESNAEEKEMMDEAIRTNSSLLETLIDDVVDFTDLEGRIQMNLAYANVISICQAAAASVMHRLPANVTIIQDTGDVPPSLMCFTDGQRVQRVLINLLTNAIKNTAQGSITLAVSMIGAAGMITFSVTDTGIGIPPDKAEVIFERFKKLDDFKQGSGLGLSICRLIATNLGGRIWLDTTHTGGARFYFQIPVVAEQIPLMQENQ